jgi:ParB/RepB/Spo0J family partition protein
MKILETKIIPIEHIRPLSENPRRMTEEEFNALVENIERVGYNQPLVVWWNEADQIYELVKGHRRYDAIKYLGQTEIECKIAEYPNREEMIMDAMADNINVGHFDPIKMMDLFKGLQAKGYDEKVIRERMAITSDAQLKRLIKQFENELPEALAEKLKAVRGEIKTIDDLSNILNQLFTEYGDTLDFNFMVFAYGNKQHLYIKSSNKNWKNINAVKDFCKIKKIDINEALDDIFSGKKKVEDFNLGSDKEEKTW